MGSSPSPPPLEPSPANKPILSPFKQNLQRASLAATVVCAGPYALSSLDLFMGGTNVISTLQWGLALSSASLVFQVASLDPIRGSELRKRQRGSILLASIYTLFTVPAVLGPVASPLLNPLFSAVGYPIEGPATRLAALILQTMALGEHPYKGSKDLAEAHTAELIPRWYPALRKLLALCSGAAAASVIYHVVIARDTAKEMLGEAKQADASLEVAAKTSSSTDTPILSPLKRNIQRGSLAAMVLCAGPYAACSFDVLTGSTELISTVQWGLAVSTASLAYQVASLDPNQGAKRHASRDLDSELHKAQRTTIIRTAVFALLSAPAALSPAVAPLVSTFAHSAAAAEPAMNGAFSLLLQGMALIEYPYDGSKTWADAHAAGLSSSAYPVLRKAFALCSGAAALGLLYHNTMRYVKRTGRFPQRWRGHDDLGREE
ncbi:hypothetical protein H9P43_004211 [Blastocladiella emersonii ATCC 22665]|nr:hypothetical protein H9P43_004211 [Blastocladiella emersonii ATCC 22665]